MASTPRSTILITGGNGSLGSAIALEAEKGQPGKYHFLLTARRLGDPRTVRLFSALEALGASFEFQILDLSSLEKVKDFAKSVKTKLGKNEIPRFAGGGIVLSAAYSTYLKDSRTQDGWNDMYGINVLASILLIIELLPVLEDALVVNVGSSAHALGTIEYFAAESKFGPGNDAAEKKIEEKLAIGDALKRYGSTKLVLTMAGYALQRSLNTES
jgi:NAD(P)-dependent dehydrogenase (short-subunit alcohol dehydrogenase family)